MAPHRLRSRGVSGPSIARARGDGQPLGGVRNAVPPGSVRPAAEAAAAADAAGAAQVGRSAPC